MTRQGDISTNSQQREGYFNWKSDAISKVAEFFAENGWAVIQGHVSQSDCDDLRDAGCKIMEEFYETQKSETAPTFTTEGRGKNDQCKDERFLKSASGITCFLETDKTNVNKIGHALHDLQEPFKRFTNDPKFVHAVAQGILGDKTEKEVVQSMYIVKGAHTGGPVFPHRDVTFVRPKSEQAEDCLGFWWPLEKADVSNGCLWVVPRSHRDGEKINKFIRSDDGKLTFSDEKSDCDMYQQEHFIPMPVDVGDLVLLHGALVHQSYHNKSSKSRHAYSIHVVNDTLAGDCWLSRAEELPFQRFC